MHVLEAARIVAAADYVLNLKMISLANISSAILFMTTILGLFEENRREVW